MHAGARAGPTGTREGVSVPRAGGRHHKRAGPEERPEGGPRPRKPTGAEVCAAPRSAGRMAAPSFRSDFAPLDPASPRVPRRVGASSPRQPLRALTARGRARVGVCPDLPRGTGRFAGSSRVRLGARTRGHQGGQQAHWGAAVARPPGGARTVSTSHPPRLGPSCPPEGPSRAPPGGTRRLLPHWQCSWSPKGAATFPR